MAAVPQWEAKTYTDAGGKALRYFLARPVADAAGAKYPLVVFMHGGGPRGTGNTSPNDSSKFFLDGTLQTRHPHFVVAPQCPPGYKCWSNHGYGEGSHKMNANPTDAIRLTFELIESLPKENVSIDPCRVYLVGVSNGSYATWDMIARRPELFAAAAPMEGGGDPSQAPKMTGLPIWAFHGTQDRVVPVRGTREMVDALKKAGANVKFTEYDSGHGGWSVPLADPAFMDWLFAQTRSPASPPPSPDPPKAAPDARAPTPATGARLRAPDAAAVAAWDARLLARLREAVKGGDRPAFRVKSMQSKVILLDVEDDGRISVDASRVKMSLPWARLSLEDRRSAALACARADVPADNALAAFYLLATGMEKEAADYLSRAGDAAAEVRRAFE